MIETNAQTQAQPLRLYRWDKPSAIAEMKVYRMAKGKVRCQLAPRSGEAGSMAEIPSILERSGFSHCYPDAINGENVLMVDRLKKPDALLAVLQEQGWVEGLPEVSLFPDAQETGNPLKRAANAVFGDTLKWSGRIGLVGHGAILANGIIKKDMNLVGGSMGALNPILLSIYGNGKSEIDFKDMMEKMTDYFRAEGVDLPLDKDPYESASLFRGVNRLLANYPVQIGHTLGSIGAYNLIKAGWKSYRAGNSKALGMAGAGATSLLGNAVVVLVPEKKKDKDEAEKTALEEIQYGLTHIPEGVQFAATKPQQVPGQMWSFIRSSPLRFNGMLNLGDNVLFLINAIGEIEGQRKQGGSQFLGLRGRLDKLTPYNSMLTALSFTVATGLATISSKNRDADLLRDEMFEPVYAAAAKFLIQMPQEERQTTIDRMAKFLAEQEAVQDAGIDASKIAEEVSKRVTPMQCSPWISKTEYCKQLQEAAVAIA